MPGDHRGRTTTVDRHEADWLETVGLLVIERGRLEQHFPMADGSERNRVDVAAAAKASGVYEKQIVRVRTVRNATVHKPADRPSLAELDEALRDTRALLARPRRGDSREVNGSCEARAARRLFRGVPRGRRCTRTRGRTTPGTTTRCNGSSTSRTWSLPRSPVARSWSACAANQTRSRTRRGRVEEAARLARAHGVIQRQEFDESLGKRVVRLYRTDPGRPTYPGSPPS